MCPYYDSLNGRCRKADSNHSGDKNCQNSEYWKKCPNVTSGNYPGVKY